MHFCHFANHFHSLTAKRQKLQGINKLPFQRCHKFRFKTLLCNDNFVVRPAIKFHNMLSLNASLAYILKDIFLIFRLTKKTLKIYIIYVRQSKGKTSREYF